MQITHTETHHAHAHTNRLQLRTYASRILNTQVFSSKCTSTHLFQSFPPHANPSLRVCIFVRQKTAATESKRIGRFVTCLHAPLLLTCCMYVWMNDLYVCMICMYDMYVWCVCMYLWSVWSVWSVCMYDLYDLYDLHVWCVCMICMYDLYACM